MVAGRRHDKELITKHSKQHGYHVCDTFPCPSLARVATCQGGKMEGPRLVMHCFGCITAEKPELREPKSFIIGNKSAYSLLQRRHHLYYTRQ